MSKLLEISFNNVVCYECKWKHHTSIIRKCMTHLKGIRSKRKHLFHSHNGCSWKSHNLFTHYFTPSEQSTMKILYITQQLTIWRKGTNASLIHSKSFIISKGHCPSFFIMASLTWGLIMGELISSVWRTYHTRAKNGCVLGSTCKHLKCRFVLCLCGMFRSLLWR